MAIINNVNEVLHRIRVKLYPNYLPHIEGAYIARTDNEASLTIAEVCAALKNRGGFTGNYEDLVEHVRQFFDETAYQLCDGFAVNTGYYSVHPNVGGTFDKVTEGHDEAAMKLRKHPVTFRFRTRSPLRALAERIVIDMEGLADVTGYIDEFLDVTTGSVNETVTPGGQFSLSGHKIKVAGTGGGVGIYFVLATDPDQSAIMDPFLAENTSSKVIGVIPQLTAGTWKLEIKTQYTVGGTLLKEPRVIESAIVLTVA
jgi:hypothetical protein